MLNDSFSSDLDPSTSHLGTPCHDGSGSLLNRDIDRILDAMEADRESMSDVVALMECVDATIDSAVEAVVVLTLVRGEVETHCSSDKLAPLMIAEAYTNL